MVDTRDVMFESIPEILEYLKQNEADSDHPFIELHDSLHRLYYKEYNVKQPGLVKLFKNKSKGKMKEMPWLTKYLNERKKGIK